MRFVPVPGSWKPSNKKGEQNDWASQKIHIPDMCHPQSFMVHRHTQQIHWSSLRSCDAGHDALWTESEKRASPNREFGTRFRLIESPRGAASHPIWDNIAVEKG
jgi:hypothetical protein